jgi:hypothetical protein
MGITKKAYKVYAKGQDGKVRVKFRSSDERRVIAKVNSLNKDPNYVEVWYEYA